jgi:hypothetical protein
MLVKLWDGNLLNISAAVLRFYKPVQREREREIVREINNFTWGNK